MSHGYDLNLLTRGDVTLVLVILITLVARLELFVIVVSSVLSENHITMSSKL